MDLAVGIAFLLLVLAFWLVPGIVSLMKGHIIAGVIGLVAFTPVAWVTSALLAKPDSAWARRFYGPDKLARARQRYAKPAPAPSASTQAPPGASPAPALATGAATGTEDWRCLICGEVSATKVAAESHVRGSHAPAPVDSSIAPA